MRIVNQRRSRQTRSDQFEVEYLGGASAWLTNSKLAHASDVLDAWKADRKPSNIPGIVFQL